MLKTLNLVVAGTGKTQELRVEEGTTARDLLMQTDLDGYVLSLGDGQPPFPNSYDLSELTPGTIVYASTPAEAGFRE